MDTHHQSSPPGADTESSDTGTSLRSGTGAPIFEPGPTTRIRRNPVRAIARLTWQGGPRQAFGRLVDLSLSGCLLKTETTIEPGTTIDLSVTLLGADDNDDYELRATVRRTTTVEGRQAYGLEFQTDSSHEKRTVQALYSMTAE